MRGKSKKVKRSMFSITGYLWFFLTISAVVSCCFLLFLNSMELDREVIRESAVRTFFNVLFLSLLCRGRDKWSMREL